MTATGLDLANPVSQPAVNVLVEAVPYDDYYSPLATGVTDSNGDYTINFSTTVDYYIRARAQSGSATNVDRVYHSASSPVVVHAASSAVLNRAAGNQVVNIHAAADASNKAGAFAVLDTVRRLRAAAAGSFPALGELDVFWSNGNTGTQFLKNGGGQTITIDPAEVRVGPCFPRTGSYRRLHMAGKMLSTRESLSLQRVGKLFKREMLQECAALSLIDRHDEPEPP